MDRIDITAFESEFEHEIAKDDDCAATRMLAAGLPIHIAREDTPPGYVVRINPDGREELVVVDRKRLADKLGR